MGQPRSNTTDASSATHYAPNRGATPARGPNRCRCEPIGDAWVTGITQEGILAEITGLARRDRSVWSAVEPDDGSTETVTIATSGPNAVAASAGGVGTWSSDPLTPRSQPDGFCQDAAASQASAKAAIEVKVQVGVASTGGAGVAPQPGVAWRRLIHTVQRPAACAGT